MALFGRRSRVRRRKAASPRTERPASALRAVAIAGVRLRDRLRAVAATKEPEEAIGEALGVVVEELGAMAAAYCLFDARTRTLRLAAEVGLSEQGCRNLRSARDGLPVGWDMPLHSLLNRRAYLIETASRNRYVPPLVEHPASIGTLACVPVEAEGRPLGSLIVVTRVPRRLADADVAALRPVLAVLATLTFALRRRAGEPGWEHRIAL
jgi:GAF domain-containing protein